MNKADSHQHQQHEACFRDINPTWCWRQEMIRSSVLNIWTNMTCFWDYHWNLKGTTIQQPSFFDDVQTCSSTQGATGVICAEVEENSFAQCYILCICFRAVVIDVKSICRLQITYYLLWLLWLLVHHWRYFSSQRIWWFELVKCEESLIFVSHIIVNWIFLILGP